MKQRMLSLHIYYRDESNRPCKFPYATLSTNVMEAKNAAYEYFKYQTGIEYTEIEAVLEDS